MFLRRLKRRAEFPAFPFSPIGARVADGQVCIEPQ
jgi:hypothetical protein